MATLALAGSAAQDLGNLDQTAHMDGWKQDLGHRLAVLRQSHDYSPGAGLAWLAWLA